MRSNILRALVVSLTASIAGAALLGCGTGLVFGDDNDDVETERACSADANPCTLEQRSRGRCISVAVADGTVCASGTCQGGECVATCAQRETSCTDGEDEDCDGRVDCADADCLGVECRAAAGACDVAEACDGTSLTCPSDAVAAASQSCGAGSRCDGSSVSCPPVDPVEGGFVISVPLALDKTEVRIGETMHATVTYANTSGAAISVRNIVIAGRPPGPVQYLDFVPEAGMVTVQPGATYTLSASRTFQGGDLLGEWRSYATYRDSDGVWHDGPETTYSVAAALVEPDPGVPTIAVARNVDLLIVAGDYWADNNTWGGGSIEFGTAPHQFEQYNGVIEYGSDGAVATRIVWRWPNPEGSSEVKGYPELIYGQKPGSLGPWGEPAGQYTLVPAPAPGEVVGETGDTPLPLQLPLSDLKARHRLAASNLSGYGHVSYDLWLQELPEQEFGWVNSSITHEIMIPLWNWGEPPYGNHPDGRNPGWYDHDVTLDGIDFAVYVAKNWSDSQQGGIGAVSPNFGGLNGEHGGRTGWIFIVFQPKQLPIVARTIDLAAIVNHVATRVDVNGTPWATGNEWLMSVELGVEPNVGTGDVTIYDYKVGRGL